MIIDSYENKIKILQEFLKICQFEGWSEEALDMALKNCQIDEKLKNLIFENGCLSLAEFYIESQNDLTLRKIKDDGDFSSQKIRDKIRILLYERFEIEKEHKIALQRLVNFYVNPKNFTTIKYGPKPLAEGLKTGIKIADFMWRAIGDQSTDFNFYTKRLTLAKIILRSLIVFLKDDSSDLNKTKKFIDLEIEKVMRFAKCKAQVKQSFSSLKAGAAHFCLNENGSLKSAKEIVKSLPFIRLF